MDIDDTNPPTPSAWLPETDLQRIATLGKLLEELGEGVAAAARCLIQGIEEVEPTTKVPNRDWLQKELADILAQVDNTVREFALSVSTIQHRRMQKFKYIRTWVLGLGRK